MPYIQLRDAYSRKDANSTEFFKHFEFSFVLTRGGLIKNSANHSVIIPVLKCNENTKLYFDSKRLGNEAYCPDQAKFNSVKL